jgi:hypothetical protein
MSSPANSSRAQSLLTAFEADDFSSVPAVLDDYLAWFRSERRSLTEVAQARDVIESCMQIALGRRAHVAAQLGRLMTVSGGYGPHRLSNTWRLDA